MNDRVKISFLPGRHSGWFPRHTNLLQAAQELGVEGLEAYCGGNGTCGKCGVRVEDGQVAVSEADRQTFSAAELTEGYRLACQVFVDEDCLVWVARSDEKDVSTILTEGLPQQAVSLDPVIQKTFVRVPTPELDDNPFDLRNTLAEAGLTSVVPALPALRKLPELLRQSDYAITCVSGYGALIDFEAGDTRSRSFGIAVDLGTTTLVAKLIDADGIVHAVVSRLNRQRVFGEDVISRIGHAADPAGLANLQKTIIDLLNVMIEELLLTANAQAEQVYEMVIAGNTVMEHLLLAIQPKYLAEMPYVPVFDRPPVLRASELGLKIHPNGWIFCFPIIGRFVGGDTTAVILSLASRPADETWLAVDIGTNG
ncbi:2Fe-2S iron-sulfur cluster binding domain-containing protein, partial [candidate division KSB1 bacterium]|nr:2Fe-2S iron-sulfur cluster binding domain-containing protein [candidate division KSB1 bacterium]